MYGNSHTICEICADKVLPLRIDALQLICSVILAQMIPLFLTLKYMCVRGVLLADLCCRRHNIWSHGLANKMFSKKKNVGMVHTRTSIFTISGGTREQKAKACAIFFCSSPLKFCIPHIWVYPTKKSVNQGKNINATKVRVK